MASLRLRRADQDLGTEGGEEKIQPDREGLSLVVQPGTGLGTLRHRAQETCDSSLSQDCRAQAEPSQSPSTSVLRTQPLHNHKWNSEGLSVLGMWLLGSILAAPTPKDPGF